MKNNQSTQPTTMINKDQISLVCLVLKRSNSKAADLGEQFKNWFVKHGIDVVMIGENQYSEGKAFEEKRPDLCIILGGDGTIVSVARRLVKSQIPLLGVNLGRVGFLAETPLSSWEYDFERILNKGFNIEWRLALSIKVERKNKLFFSGFAVNDAVIGRGALARLVSLDLCVGDECVGAVRADGLIIATPTGVSGYSVSAGGPLILPSLNVISVTPICPFLCNFKSLVLGHESAFTLSVREGGPDLFLTRDGQDMLPLKVGDSITIKGLPNALAFAKIEGRSSYFARLQQKGFIGLAPS
ncbi:NAD(+)/NADH kinase [Desulfovibrio litoralis]|uniref:NAD kinase n=1 Tax=Desulfovibrio litoralis DSM 11393 TaxID=1121455 RepID=A0A1M7SNV5_9BACT|nr:NAD(+)/NADH kinase [Desulfovibrio litoralis]SHN60098.1 NAD+ kinase [Desulfovibrio litoralis DSM 11393]